MREEAHGAAAGAWAWRDVKDEMATSLPYGKQRRLEIARALATDPKLLLLDEPAAGMNPQETQELADFIREIREKYRPDRPSDRASHGSGHGDLRPYLCAGLRQAHRPGHARGGPEQSRGSLTHIWGWQTMLKIDESARSATAASRPCKGIILGGAGRRDRHADRRQRRRQVHHAAHHRRAGEGPAAAPSPTTARSITGHGPPTRSSPGASPWCPRGGGCSPT